MNPEFWIAGEASGELDDGNLGNPEFWIRGEADGDIEAAAAPPGGGSAIPVQIIWF